MYVCMYVYVYVYVYLCIIAGIYDQWEHANAYAEIAYLTCEGAGDDLGSWSRKCIQT